MNWSKAELKKSIEEARVGIEMTAQIMIALEEFGHYMQVNKRFTDRMKELGCHAYIQKDNYSSVLSISKCEGYGMPKAEFRLYVSHIMANATFTWNGIKAELARYDFEERLKHAQERLELIDKETVEAQELLAIIKSKNFKCFDFYKSVHEIEDAIRVAQS